MLTGKAITFLGTPKDEAEPRFEDLTGRSLLFMGDMRFWDASSVELLEGRDSKCWSTWREWCSERATYHDICTSPVSSRLLFLVGDDAIKYSGDIADGMSLL